MSDDLEKQFLDAITRNPDDEDARAVYADWLEGRGDPRGEYLRLELQMYKLPKRMAELASAIDESWLEAISRNFDVLLCDPGPNKISVIKEVREMTGLGLKDSKDIIDRASTASPYVVAKRLDLETANRVAQRLADAGATFQIDGHIAGRPPPSPPPRSRVRLVLHAVGPQRLEAIKLVREATGLGLADAKSLVERVIAGVPEQLTDILPPAQAERLALQLSRVGRATVEPI